MHYLGFGLFFFSCHFTSKKTFFELQVLLDVLYWKMIYTLLKGKGRKEAGVVRLWALPGQVKTC